MKEFLNPDGKTYNGVAALSAISGLSQSEVKWRFDRINHLLNVEKKSKAETLAIIKTEEVNKPWLNNG